MTPTRQSIGPLLPQLEHELLTTRERLQRGRRRQRARAGFLAFALAVAAALVATLALAGDRPSLVARAEAAVSADNAILHWVQITHTGPPVTVIRREVWELGTRTHALLTFTTGESRRTLEQVRNGRMMENYFDGTIEKITLPPAWAAHALTCTGVSAILPRCVAGTDDLVAALRRLYGSGHIHFLGQGTFNGRRVDVFVASGGPVGVRSAGGFSRRYRVHFRVLVNARTLMPAEIQVTSAGGFTSIIEQFQRLPITAGNEKLLGLRAHPHARVITIRPRTMASR